MLFPYSYKTWNIQSQRVHSTGQFVPSVSSFEFKTDNKFEQIIFFSMVTNSGITEWESIDTSQNIQNGRLVPL